MFPGLSVRDNLRAALAAHPAERRDAERRIANVFDVFPALSARRNQDAASLSGGEQQMLALGCALLFEPQLLLIDELSLGLAPLVVHSLLAVVERLKAEGYTMVIVEQSLNIAAAISDRVIFIEKGRIRFDGPTSELAARDDLARAVFLGGEGGYFSGVAGHGLSMPCDAGTGSSWRRRRGRRSPCRPCRSRVAG